MINVSVGIACSFILGSFNRQLKSCHLCLIYARIDSRSCVTLSLVVVVSSLRRVAMDEHDDDDDGKYLTVRFSIVILTVQMMFQFNREKRKTLTD